MAALALRKMQRGQSLLILKGKLKNLLQLPKKRGWSKFFLLPSIERDAQLLANRIALLKQEEMKTWKKIEETKKRAQEVNMMKRKNDEKMNKKIEEMRTN